MIGKEAQEEAELVIQRLNKKIEGSQVYFIHEDGQLISHRTTIKDAVGTASVLASFFSAAKMLNQMSGYEGFYELGIWANKGGLFAFPVSERYFLAVGLSQKKYPGWVMMKCRTEVAALVNIIEKGNDKDQYSKEDNKRLFQNISDKEIDDLFGGI